MRFYTTLSCQRNRHHAKLRSDFFNMFLSIRKLRLTIVSVGD